MTVKLAKCRDCTRAYVAPRASAFFSCEATKVLGPRNRERKSCAWFVARVAQNQWRAQ